MPTEGSWRYKVWAYTATATSVALFVLILARGGYSNPTTPLAVTDRNAGKQDAQAATSRPAKFSNRVSAKIRAKSFGSDMSDYLRKMYGNDIVSVSDATVSVRPGSLPQISFVVSFPSTAFNQMIKLAGTNLISGFELSVFHGKILKTTIAGIFPSHIQTDQPIEVQFYSPDVDVFEKDPEYRLEFHTILATGP